MNSLISLLLAFTTCATLFTGSESVNTVKAPAKDEIAAVSQTVSVEAEPVAAAEEGTVVDLTEKLNNLMRENEKVLQAYLDEHGYIAATLYYYVKVTDGGEWDIKVTDEWAFEPGKTYVYEGKKLRMDDPGNIHFGYLGAMLFPEEFVCFGAGMNNFLKFGTVDGDLSSYYDDPQDQEMMRFGFRMFKERTLW